MKGEWIVFKNRSTGEKYTSITVEGATREDISSTIDLIAYGNKVERELVTYELSDRP